MKSIKTCFLVFIASFIVACGPPAPYTLYSFDFTPLETNLPTNSTGTITFYVDDLVVLSVDLQRGIAQTNSADGMFDSALVDLGIFEGNEGLGMFETSNSRISANSEVFKLIHQWEDLDALSNITEIKFEIDGYATRSQFCKNINTQSFVNRLSTGDSFYDNTTRQSQGEIQKHYSFDCGSKITFSREDNNNKKIAFNYSRIGDVNPHPIIYGIYGGGATARNENIRYKSNYKFEIWLEKSNKLTLDTAPDILIREKWSTHKINYFLSMWHVGDIESGGRYIELQSVSETNEHIVYRYLSNTSASFSQPELHLAVENPNALASQSLTIKRFFDVESGDTNFPTHTTELNIDFPNDFYLPKGFSYQLPTMAEGKDNQALGVTPRAIDWLLFKQQSERLPLRVESEERGTNSVTNTIVHMPTEPAAGEEIKIELVFSEPFVFKKIPSEAFLSVFMFTSNVNWLNERNFYLDVPENWRGIEFTSLFFKTTIRPTDNAKNMNFSSINGLTLNDVELVSENPISLRLPNFDTKLPLGKGIIEDISFSVSDSKTAIISIEAINSQGFIPSPTEHVYVVNSNVDNTLKWLVAFDQPVTNITPSMFKTMSTGNASADVVSVEPASEINRLKKNSDEPVYDTRYYVFANNPVGEGDISLIISGENEVSTEPTPVSYEEFSRSTLGGIIYIVIPSKETYPGLALSSLSPANIGKFRLINTPPQIIDSEFTMLTSEDGEQNVIFNQELRGITRGSFEHSDFEENDTFLWQVNPHTNGYTYSFHLPDSNADVSSFLSRIRSKNTIQNLAGIYMDGTTDGSGTVDLISPTLQAINILNEELTNARNVEFELMFSEPIDFEISDFELTSDSDALDITNASLLSASVSSTKYNITASGYEGEGILGLSLKSGTLSTTDQAKNHLDSRSAYTASTYSIDTKSPELVSFNRLGVTETSSSLLEFMLVFSEKVENVSLDDFAVDAADTLNTANLAIEQISASEYKISLSVVSGIGEVAVGLVSNNDIRDLYSNPINSQATRSQMYNVIDDTAPTLQISDVKNALTSDSYTVTFSFSEPVYGFESEDIQLTNASKGLFTQESTSVYTLDVLPLPNNAQDINIVVNSDIATDIAKNGNFSASHLVKVLLVPDTTAPVITLIGTNLTIIKNEVYDDAGATATDDVDGDISSLIVVGGTVDSSIAGVYVLSYDVSDDSGNQAVTVYRTVTVALPPDTTSPVITLVGGDESVFLGEQYIDQGATAIDETDGDISTSIIVSGVVDTSTVGMYTITYMVTDNAGNAAVLVTREVSVLIDNIAPPSPILVLANDSGRSASDGITNDAEILVSNIEAGATWEYSSDSGATWQTGTNNSFQLNEGSYTPANVLVRQSDASGNISEKGSLQTAVNIDKTSPENELAEASPGANSFQQNNYVTGGFVTQILKVGNNGDFIAVWVGQTSQSSVDTAIFIQSFNAIGGKTGEEIMLDRGASSNVTNAYLQIRSLNSDGDFIVGWSAQDEELDDSVFLQRFNADMSPQGEREKLEKPGELYGDDSLSDILVLSDGRYVVVWIGGRRYGGSTSTYVQLFEADGTRATSTPFTSLRSFGGQLAQVSADGGYVLTSRVQDASGYAIGKELFDKDGEAIGGMQIFRTPNITNSHNDIEVQSLPDYSGYIISWSVRDDPSQSDPSVFFQKYNSSGVAIGGQIKLEASDNQSGTDDEAKFVSLGNTGSFVIAWAGQDVSSNDSVYVQQFDASNNPSSSQVKLAVNDISGGDISIEQLLFDSTSGGYIVVWQSVAFSPARSATYFQRFNSSGTAVGSIVKFEPSDNGVAYNTVEGAHIVNNEGVLRLVTMGYDSAFVTAKNYHKRYKANNEPIANVPLGDFEALSNETGTAYLVSTSVLVSSVDDILNTDNSLWKSVDVTEDIASALISSDLNNGEYRLYTVDIAGNVSEASTFTATIAN